MTAAHRHSMSIHCVTTLRYLLLILSVSGVAITSSSHAQLTIEITRGVEGALPIAVVPFQTVDQLALAEEQSLASIISANLRRSGRFDPYEQERYSERPSQVDEIAYAGWRERFIDYLVVGKLQPSAANPDSYQVQFQLVDIFQGLPLLGLEFSVRENELRRLAHHISDLIYEKLTGERGAFNTRVAYINVTGSTANPFYTLSVADADGFNPQSILRSPQPLMSPAWSPDGRQLAYVSFENRRAQIIVQDLYSGSRKIVSASPGINGAPAWSPDGQQLAFTLSKDGDPEIYIYGLATTSLRRLTFNTAIDTEPTWSPDGRTIVFTSDRGGNPQLYQIGLTGQQPRRLTYDGNYNARARFSPDGQYLALVHRRDKRFQIATLDLQSRELQPLTDTGLHESPSFAPNGRMIIYASSVAGRGVLAAVSIDGRVQQRLAAQSGAVREPSWAPYPR